MHSQYLPSCPKGLNDDIVTREVSSMGDSGEQNRKHFRTWCHVTLAAPRLVQVMTLVHERRRFLLRLKVIISLRHGASYTRV